MKTKTAPVPGTAAPLLYHLRFQIIPGPHVRRDAADLAAFCERHGIPEVVLFFAAEEWNNGLLSRAEEERWLEAVSVAKTILEKHGIVVSLNPWMTVLHCDRGRGFPRGRGFAPTVSPLGEVAKACASFADPAWQRYFLRLMGRFAALGFRVIWVEDDFRYHNHGPLTWGGGFEPEVLARFSRKTGREVTREEVVAALLRPGRPHPWRRLWMQTWREIQLEVARKLARTVARHTPGQTRLGLMSSYPPVHSTEGRDWQALFKALSIDGQVAHRPHYAGYAEAPGRAKTYSMMMLDVQKTFRPPGCEVAPEVENFPFTRWNKSDSLTWSEMALCQFHGARALLLDLFPFTGNRASAEPAIGELLDRSRPALEWIGARFPQTLATAGVAIPWKPEAQRHLRTAAGKSLSEFDATNLGPAEFLLPYGVPVTASSAQPVTAIFGNLAWAFSAPELRQLLSGGLLLDAVSARILCRRGFGALLGVRVAEIAERENARYALEQVTSAESGAEPGLYFNANLVPRMGRLEPLTGAKEWTSILQPDGRRFGAGIVAFKNRLGGRVVTCATPDPGQLPRCDQRQAIVQNALRFLADDRFDSVLVTGAPFAMPTHFREPVYDRIVVFNGTTDPAQPTVRFRPPPGRKLRTATLLAPLAAPRAMKTTVRQEHGVAVVTCAEPLPYLSYLVLEWR